MKIKGVIVLPAFLAVVVCGARRALDGAVLATMAGEAGASVQEDVSQDLTDYRAAAKALIEKVEIKLKAWGLALEERAGWARATAQEKIRSLEDRVRKQRKVLESLSLASNAVWRDMRDIAFQVKRDLEDAYDDARRSIEG